MLFPLRAAPAAVLAALLLAPGAAAAQDVVAGTLLIRQPWARATPAGAQVAGGYVTIVNRGQAGETLLGGTLAAAGKAEVHDMTMADGIMRMRPTGPLDIPPGGTLVLSPTGRHLMFTGLQRGLRKGEAVEGTLDFAHAGSVPVRFAVEGIGARAPAGRDGHAMPGMDMK